MFTYEMIYEKHFLNWFLLKVTPTKSTIHGIMNGGGGLLRRTVCIC